MEKKRNFEISEERFLETVTFMGNDVLIPIDRIKYINMSSNENGFVIKITSDDGEWDENFYIKEEIKAKKRYKMLKEIIKAK